MCHHYLHATLTTSSLRTVCDWIVSADLAEQQRALATLGRTYFVQSLSGDVGEEEARELRLHAGNANLKSLDVCDKLGGVVPDRLNSTHPLSYLLPFSILHPFM